MDLDRCTARERHQPMCMSQYGRVFTSYRRPGIPKDKLISFETDKLTNQYIIVMNKNHVGVWLMVTNYQPGPGTQNYHSAMAKFVA